MEGPQFSTLAESKLYRSWGMDVIGMTNLQEAKLAREAEICYTTIALVTDYDCWHPRSRPGDGGHDRGHPDAERAEWRSRSSPGPSIGCRSNARASARARSQYAIITRPDAIPADVKQELAPLVGKYLTQ